MDERSQDSHEKVGRKELLDDGLSIGHAKCLDGDPVAAVPAPHPRDANQTIPPISFTKHTESKLLSLYIQRLSGYFHQKVPGVWYPGRSGRQEPCTG